MGLVFVVPHGRPESEPMKTDTQTGAIETVRFQGINSWAVLHLGDCLDMLPIEADAVITDPPYGISHSSSHGASWQNTCIAGDSDTSARDTALDGFKVVAACGTWKTPPIANTRGCVVWDKGPAFGMGDLAFPWKPSFELVYIRSEGWAGKRDEGVLRGPVVVSWESKGRMHPHEKPVWLMASFITKLPESFLILDPFMGSGTTGIACLRTGRNFVGVERDEKHFKTACERFAREVDGQLL